MHEKITVVKLIPVGIEKWRYETDLIAQGEGWRKLQALFMNEDRPFIDILLKKGDRWEETYYSERWYNVFEIFDRDDGAPKGYYCNVSRPAIFLHDRVEYEDLFLDLWVSADGTQHVLDEDEFIAAELDEATRQGALNALAELQKLFESKRPPF